MKRDSESEQALRQPRASGIPKLGSLLRPRLRLPLFLPYRGSSESWHGDILPSEYVHQVSIGCSEGSGLQSAAHFHRFHLEAFVDLGAEAVKTRVRFFPPS